MKNLIWISGLLFLSVAFLGCNSSNNNDQPAPQPVVAVCAPGQYYSNGGCFSGAGFVGPSGLTLPRGFYADNYSGTSRITVVNAQKMKELFKFGMGVCDRAAHNYGQAGCDAYLAGSLDIILQFPQTGASNTLLATFIARPKYNPYYNYQAQLPSGWGLVGVALGYTTGVWLPDPQYYTGAERNPLQLQMVVSTINNSLGFEARGNGDYQTGLSTTVLGIQVPQGKVEDNSFNFNLTVQGATAAQGVMTRCQTSNCGL